jgi:hypothetical protein
MGKLYPMQERKILYIVLFLLSGFVANAQSLKTMDINVNPKGFIGEDIRTALKVKNTSNKTLYFTVTILKKQIGSSQSLYLCVDNDCKNRDIAKGDAKITDRVHKLLPNETNESIVAVLESGLVQGISSITYRVSNVKQPSDFIDIELHYNIKEPPKEGLLYSSIAVDLSDVYPNPVIETAIFDYKIKNDSKEAKIIIHNVLGSIAGEYQLNPFEQQLKISVEDYNPGVYFYSLYIDNEGVATKKLVVRK